MTWPKKFLIGIGGLFGLSFVIAMANAGAGKGQPTPQEAGQEKQDSHRTNMAYLAAKALKASLRNPDSLSFEQILANKDGSIICMTYRAQNGFGGMNVEHVVFKDGNPSQTHASWHTNCAHKVLIDLTAVQSMI